MTYLDLASNNKLSCWFKLLVYKMKKLSVLATNVTGLGANYLFVQLKNYWLSNQNRCRNIKKDELFFAESRVQSRWQPVRRIAELFFGWLTLPRSEKYLIFGDIPYFGLRNQIVFVQQAHILKPAFSPFSGKSIKFKVMRGIFAINKNFCKSYIVQTEHMKIALAHSYSILPAKIFLMPHGTLSTFHSVETAVAQTEASTKKKLILFYPAGFYRHKNFDIIEKLAEVKKHFSIDFELRLTLSDSEFDQRLRSLPFLKNLGRLSRELTIGQFLESDALFFPSTLESLGLPLLEAMSYGKDIICSDLPYSREICGTKAFYFNSQDAAAVISAIQTFSDYKQNQNNTDWTQELNQRLNLPDTFQKLCEIIAH